MLILGRKLGEKVMIGDNIVVTVTAIDNDQVRLGIDAPKEIDVHREEIYKKIQRQNDMSFY